MTLPLSNLSDLDHCNRVLIRCSLHTIEVSFRFNHHAVYSRSFSICTHPGIAATIFRWPLVSNPAFPDTVTGYDRLSKPASDDRNCQRDKSCHRFRRQRSRGPTQLRLIYIRKSTCITKIPQTKLKMSKTVCSRFMIESMDLMLQTALFSVVSCPVHAADSSPESGRSCTSSFAKRISTAVLSSWPRAAAASFSSCS